MSIAKVVFKLKSDIRIGLGILRTFNEEVAYLGIQHPLIICDQNLMDSDYFKEVESGIKSFAINGRFLSGHILKDTKTCLLLAQFAKNNN